MAVAGDLAPEGGNANGLGEISFVVTAASSATEGERIKVEWPTTQEADQTLEKFDGCTGESNFEWLVQGARSAGREVDFGRRSGVGTSPTDTENVFRPESCYFAG